MIKFQDYTPDIYYKESRDFQFIGRLFDIILNSVKTEADLLYNLPAADNLNEKLLDLLSYTLGFKPKHHYSTVQLRAICSVFPQILRNKGSIQAIIIACNALFQAEGLEQAMDYSFTGRDHTDLTIYIPHEFGDLTLLNDLLEYIIPAGVSCNIIKELAVKDQASTEVAIDNIFKLYSDGEAIDYENRAVFYDNNILASIPRFSSNQGSNVTRGENFDINSVVEGVVKDNVGFIANGIIYKPVK